VEEWEKQGSTSTRARSTGVAEQTGRELAGRGRHDGTDSSARVPGLKSLDDCRAEYAGIVRYGVDCRWQVECFVVVIALGVWRYGVVDKVVEE